MIQTIASERNPPTKGMSEEFLAIAKLVRIIRIMIIPACQRRRLNLPKKERDRRTISTIIIRRA